MHRNQPDWGAKGDAQHSKQTRVADARSPGMRQRAQYIQGRGGDSVWLEHGEQGGRLEVGAGDNRVV